MIVKTSRGFVCSSIQRVCPLCSDVTYTGQVDTLQSGLKGSLITAINVNISTFGRPPSPPPPAAGERWTDVETLVVVTESGAWILYNLGWTLGWAELPGESKELGQAATGKQR